jgi:hypothetical protein
MFRQTAEGVEISLHVLPNAPKSQIVGTHNNKLKIKIKAPPVDGKANEAIVAFFSEYLGIAKSQINVDKGEKSKSKTILIRGVPLAELQSHLLQSNNS